MMMGQKHEALQRQHSGIWRSLRDEDFEEEDYEEIVFTRVEDLPSKLN